MQDKDSIRGSINKRMNVVHRCIRTPNIVLSVRTDHKRLLSKIAKFVAEGIICDLPFSTLEYNLNYHR